MLIDGNCFLCLKNDNEEEMTVLGAKSGLLATENYPVCRGEGEQ